MEPYIEHVKHVHTDGFITDVALDLKTGNDLSQVKFEGYVENCVIHNNIKIVGNFH
jgi:hypothetical protein